jgi:hypothetical protein
MVGPIMRTIGPPDLAVRTMAMPHLMFYAPNLTNEDIGAVPNLSDHASLLYPFVDRQGVAEHTYMIQLIGESVFDATWPTRSRASMRSARIARCCACRTTCTIDPHSNYQTGE